MYISIGLKNGNTLELKPFEHRVEKIQEIYKTIYANNDCIIPAEYREFQYNNIIYTEENRVGSYIINQNMFLYINYTLNLPIETYKVGKYKNSNNNMITPDIFDCTELIRLEFRNINKSDETLKNIKININDDNSNSITLDEFIALIKLNIKPIKLYTIIMYRYILKDNIYIELYIKNDTENVLFPWKLIIRDESLGEKHV